MKRIYLVFCVMAFCLLIPMNVSAQGEETELTGGFVPIGIGNETEQDGTQEAGGEKTFPASYSGEDSATESETDISSGMKDAEQSDSNTDSEQMKEQNGTEVNPVSNDQKSPVSNAQGTGKTETEKENSINTQSEGDTSVDGSQTAIEKEENHDVNELELSDSDDTDREAKTSVTARDENPAKKEESNKKKSRAYLYIIALLGIIVVAAAAFIMVKRKVNIRK